MSTTAEINKLRSERDAYRAALRTALGFLRGLSVAVAGLKTVLDALQDALDADLERGA